MHEPDSHDLLAQYAKDSSEKAFAMLVARHVNLVYSVALRHVANPDAAKDIAQVVFLLLARKAGSISRQTILSGWLYKTARLTAANYLRMENRRQRREQELHMQSTTKDAKPDAWAELAPVLDVAMERLGSRERDAVVLRYFEGKSLKEVGRALGSSEDAAQKSVERAVGKLRTFFAKRGVALSAATITTLLLANSVQAAPAGLAGSIITAGISKGATITGSTLLLMKSTLNMMAWLKIKTVGTATLCVILVAATATTAIAQVQKNKDIKILASTASSIGVLPAQSGQVAPKQAGILVAANTSSKTADTEEAPPTVSTAYGISGVVLWLAADSGVTLDAKGNVTALADKTGNFILTPNTPDMAPSYVSSGPNNRPVLRFNGSQSLYSSDNFGGLLNKDMTFIVVTMTTAPATLEEFSLYLGQNSTPHVNRDVAYLDGKELFDGQFVACRGTSVVTKTFVMTGMSINPALTEATFYQNGRQVTTGTVSDENKLQNNRKADFEDLSEGVTMGAATDPVCGWQGDIAEELVYDRQLTPGEMQSIWFTLSSKYGLHEDWTPVSPITKP